LGGASEGRHRARSLWRVEEIAAAVAFIAGPESSYITGSNLTVDGGMNAERKSDRSTSNTNQIKKVFNANVVKKYSISYELAQKMVVQRWRKPENLGLART